jgi:hypothetical protein
VAVARPAGVAVVPVEPTSNSEPKYLLVGGQFYSTLKWHLGHRPTKHEINHARTTCADGAIEYKDTTARGLGNFVVVESMMDQAKEIFGDVVVCDEWKVSETLKPRAREPSRAVPSFKLAESQKIMYGSLQQVLFRRIDLKREF